MAAIEKINPSERVLGIHLVPADAETEKYHQPGKIEIYNDLRRHARVGMSTAAKEATHPNEDRASISKEGRLVLSDGMGGHPAGEVAAFLTNEVTDLVFSKQHISSRSSSLEVQDTLQLSYDLVTRCMAVVEDVLSYPHPRIPLEVQLSLSWFKLNNETIFPFSIKLKSLLKRAVEMVTLEEADSILNGEQMGVSTITSQFIEDDALGKVIIGYLGDCSAYSIKRNGDVERITFGHTQVYELFELSEAMHVLPELFSTFEKATDVDDFIVRIQRVAFFADDKPDDLAQLYEEKDILTRYLNSNEYNHYSPTVTEYVVSENDLAICLFSDGMNNLTTEEMTEILTRDEFEMRKVHAPEAAIVTVNIINHQLIQAAQKKSLTGGHHSKPDDITAAYMLLKNKFTKGSLQ